MVSHWHNAEKLNQRKRHTLRSLGVGFVFFVFLYILTSFFSTSLCPIYNVFGVKCPGCGMTRGFIAILHFDFKSAFSYNVLSVPIFVGIFIYAVLAIVDIAFNKDYVYSIEKQMSKPYMYVVYVIILVVSYILNY